MDTSLYHTYAIHGTTLTWMLKLSTLRRSQNLVISSAHVQICRYGELEYAHVQDSMQLHYC